MFRNVLFGLAAIAIIVSIGLSTYTYSLLAKLQATLPQTVSPSETYEVPPPSAEKVVALGRLEPAGGVIDLNGLPGDRLESLHVKVDDLVEKGAVLAQLESHRLRAAEQSYAAAALEEARIRQAAEQAYADTLVAEAELGVEQAKLLELDLDAQQAQIKVLEAHLAVARKNYERLERLSGSKASIVSAYELEQQQLLVQKADAELAAAQAQAEKLKATAGNSLKQASVKLQAAHAADARQKAATQLGALEKKVTLTEEQLALSVIRAPAAGRVLKIFVQPGETLGQLPILRMGQVDQMYAVAEVYETDAARVEKDQRARISSPALSKPLEGTVESVGVTVGKNEMLSIDPTKRADLRVVEAWIKLDDSSDAAKLVNLQVRVEIDTPVAKAGSAANQTSAAGAAGHER